MKTLQQNKAPNRKFFYGFVRYLYSLSKSFKNIFLSLFLKIIWTLFLLKIFLFIYACFVEQSFCLLTETLFKIRTSLKTGEAEMPARQPTRVYHEKGKVGPRAAVHVRHCATRTTSNLFGNCQSCITL